MDTFPFTPSYATTVSFEPQLLTSPFGDGYDQQAPDGFQNFKLRLNVVFEKISDLEANQVLNFIRAQGGYRPFLWTPIAPWDDSGALMFKCSKADDVHNEWNSRTITLPFVQTFNPE